MSAYQNLYDSSLNDPIAFWAEQAKNIAWYTFPTNILTQEDGLHRWYKGGKLNTCYLALDYHCENGRGNQTALIYDSPVTNTKKKYTYLELKTSVAKFAGVLRKLGVTKGDRVIIYMPMIPEAVIGMLACARLGAVHSVVFGGFAPTELAIRIDDARPKVILTASCGIEFDKIIPYKPLIDTAIEQATHKLDAVVVFQRPEHQATLIAGRDFDWVTLNKSARPATCVKVDATDPLYILYTSGTTGKPKGIVRDNGGHAVVMKFSMPSVYASQPSDVYWAASDIGWAVGHSYTVYGPLINGATTVFYEGKPVRTPDAGSFWRVMEEYKVNTFFTAPTAFRAIKKEDPNGYLKQKYDTSHLRHVFVAGERCDVSTLNWLLDLTKVPVIDHWWQTESGSPMLANMVGVELLPIKAGSAGKCVPSFDIQILDANAQPVAANIEGAVGIKLPLPPGCLPTLWENDARFVSAYLTAYPDYYFSGDGGYKDEDGYVYITGRIDDVINVAGHRLSTSDMEEIVSAHPAVAECAVVGVEDNMKGQVPVGFVVLKAGSNLEDGELEQDLIKMVREKIGAVAFFRRAVVTKRLPKTRSGKILRNIMRSMADGKTFNPPSTIEDMSVLSELQDLMQEKHIGIAFDDTKQD